MSKETDTKTSKISPSAATVCSPLARWVAHYIFSAMSLPAANDDECQRLQAKGGKYPDAETDLGGLCEEALAILVDTALRTENVQVSEPATTDATS